MVPVRGLDRGHEVGDPGTVPTDARRDPAGGAGMAVAHESGVALVGNIPEGDPGLREEAEIGMKAEPMMPNTCSMPCRWRTFTKASSVVILTQTRPPLSLPLPLRSRAALARAFLSVADVSPSLPSGAAVGRESRLIPPICARNPSICLRAGPCSARNFSWPPDGHCGCGWRCGYGGYSAAASGRSPANPEAWRTMRRLIGASRWVAARPALRIVRTDRPRAR